MMDTIDKDALRERIERVLSEILSDKHDCKITLRFVPKGGDSDAGRKAPAAD